MLGSANKWPGRALRAGLAALAVALVLAAREPRLEERPWKAQLHVHGSFSEGVGSIDSHAFHALATGLDVLWWSDHDFRIASYRCVSTFDFEAIEQPIHVGEEWDPRWDRERQADKRIAFARGGTKVGDKALSNEAYAGQRSLLVRAANESQRFKPKLFLFETARNLQRRPLAAGVTVQLAIQPKETSEDARIVVDLKLSEHRVEERWVDLALRYVLDNEGQPRREKGVYVVPLPYTEGEWTLYELPVTQHAVEGFPEILGEDNSLHEITFGVETRNGATAAALFDELKISTARDPGEMLAVQRELMARVGEAYPDLVQLQGIEISYAATHLNEFSVDTRLPDYERHVTEMLERSGATSNREFNNEISKRVSRDVRTRDGLISYNHPFGAETIGRQARRSREASLTILTNARLYGADILEVGYRERGGRHLDDHLWLWDALAREGYAVVGVGVSDAHEVRPGVPRPNNMVSWIYAPATTKADLVEGLRRGRVYFGDPVLFDGTVDLTTSDGHRMGDVVVTEADEATVTIHLAGLTPGHLVHVVGPDPAPEPWLVEQEQLRRDVTFSLGAPIVPFRVEVRDARRDGVVFSNPIVFVRDAELLKRAHPARRR